MLEPDPGVASTGVNFYTPATFKPATWSRRKEIAYGTQGNINPTRTMFRRMALVAQKVGPAMAYYCWLLERIGTGSTTRFKIEEAAQALGVNRRGIERHNAALAKLGFITVTNRSYKGKLTYSEYTLHPINEVIGDCGHATTKVSQRRYDKSVVTKRVINKEEAPAVLSPSSSQPKVAKQAEAGRGLRPSGLRPSATASFGAPGSGHDETGWDEDEIKSSQHTRPDSLLESVSRWSEQELGFLISCGFKPRTHQSLTKDALSFLKSREDLKNINPIEQWESFLETYSVLRIKLPTIDFIKKGQHKLGAGALFRPTMGELNEVYFETLFTSPRFGGIQLPDTIFRPGEIIQSPHGTRGRVLSVDSAGYHCRLLDSAETMTVDLYKAVAATPVVAVAATEPEALVPATAGPVLGLAVADEPPRPCEDDGPRETPEEAELGVFLRGLVD